MKKVLFIVFILHFSFSKRSLSQSCTTLNIISSNVIPATCPSGGSISIVATGTNLIFQMISGPSGYSTATNTTGNFTTLSYGNYIVEVRDACAVKTTVALSVTNAYPTFNISSVSASNVCTSNISGGTITANVVGGNPPYQYAIVPAGGTPIYGTSTSSTSFIENQSNFGIFRVYVKDGCGEVRTNDIEILQTQPTPIALWWEDIVVNRPCTETMDGLPTVSWNLHFLAQNGEGINFNTLLGSTYSIYKPNPSNSISSSSVNCSTLLGTLLNSGTILSSNIDPADPFTYPVTIPQEDVILVFTNKCGAVFKYCYNINEGNPIVPTAFFDVIQEECGATWNTQYVDILLRNVFNMSAPYTFLLTKNGGATETNSIGKFWYLLPSDLPATVNITDACGRTITKNMTMPIQGSALQAVIEPEWTLSCTNVIGAASAYIRISGGDLPGQAQATNIAITGGTATAIPSISQYDYWIPGYIASNLLAGHNYKIVLTNLCGEKDSIMYTVPADQWGQNTLSWNLTATVNALCGQNKSTINAVSNFSGHNAQTYYLYNLTAPNTAIANNNSGVFTNVLPGNYKVKFVVLASTNCPGQDIKDSLNLTVINDAIGQSITRKTITTCEVNGVPMSSGKVVVDVDGSAPFTYEAIKTNLVGTGATEVWNLSSTNNPSSTYTWDIPLAGDPSNTQYTLRSTDKCGNKVTTQASLQPLNNPTIVSQNNPCINDVNYTLTINPYAGAFTYRWVKLPDMATTLSTQNKLVFPGNYVASNNGTYRCYIDLAGCVDRIKDVQISSTNCLTVLPNTILSLNGSINNEVAVIKWVSANETNVANYELEKSLDGKNFFKIHTVLSVRNNAPENSYFFNDPLIGKSEEILYYRIKTIEINGGELYSSIIRLNKDHKKNQLLIYPSPTHGDITLSYNSGANNNIIIHILDNTGRKVWSAKKAVKMGNNIFKLTEISKFQNGTYFFQVIDGDIIENIKFVKL